jgi:excinuclease ABC subunit B
MRAAAADLEFETAARIRDEIRRLEAVELAIADDPLIRQYQIEARVAESTGGRTRKSEGTASTLLSKPRRPTRRRH